MIVPQKQQRLLALIIFPVKLILRDLYLESESKSASWAFILKEYALPLKQYIYGLEAEA